MSRCSEKQYIEKSCSLEPACIRCLCVVRVLVDCSEEETGSRAAKRRKQRQQEKAAAAAETGAATPKGKSGTAAATPTRSKENKHVGSDSNGDANGSARPPAAAATAAATGGVTGVAPHEAVAAARGGGGEKLGEAGTGGDSRGALSPKQQEQAGGSKSRSGQQGKGKAGDDKRRGRATKSVSKVGRGVLFRKKNRRSDI